MQTIMIIGSESDFALESSMTEAYERISFRALGYFLIHLVGKCYGVRSPDATMLACSFEEVRERISRRGKHTAPFSTHPDGGEIAEAFREAGWGADGESKEFFGMSSAAFQDIIYSNHINWAPDGDAAFDDGSYVLHFDVGDQVRLIAFKCNEDNRPAPSSLSDKWLPADEFYDVLHQWQQAFEAEWLVTPKTPESA